MRMIQWFPDSKCVNHKKRHDVFKGNSVAMISHIKIIENVIISKLLLVKNKERYFPKSKKKKKGSETER